MRLSAKMNPLKIKLQIAWIFVLSLAVIWSAAFYELKRSYAASIKKTEEATRFASQAFAENTLPTIKLLDEVLLDLRTYWGGKPGRFAEAVQQRQSYIDKLAFQVSVLDANGYLAYSNLGMPKERIYLGDREVFQAHRTTSDDRLFISRPIKGKLSDKWSIQLARSVFVNRRFHGVIVLSLYTDIFRAFSAKTDLADGSCRMMVRNDGALMARSPNDAQAWLDNIGDAPYLAAGAPVSGSFLQTDRQDRIKRLYGYYKQPEYGLNFVVGHALKEELAPYFEHQRAVVATALIISLLVTFLIGLLLRAERRLRDSQAMLQSAIATIGEAFVIFDENDRLFLCNKQYCEYYSASAKMLIPGRTFAEIIRYGAENGQYPQAVGRVEEWIAERMTAHRSGNSDLIQQLNNGRWLRIRERKTPEGLYVGCRVDITELYEARKTAEEASLAKSRFLATMSHELRTPMNGILGMAQLLLLPGLDEKESKDYARTILHSGQMLLTLLNDILDLSKVEAGKVDLEQVVFSPDQLLQETATLYVEDIGKKGLTLDNRWQGSADQRYRADPTRLRQMLSNLLSNAIKFTEHGQIRVEAYECQREKDFALLQFSVTDSGIGIPQDRQAVLFQPFVQTDSSTTRKYGGTGLGLSIVRNLAKLMGGDAGVESEVGHGSRFWFTIRADLVQKDGESRQAAHQRTPGTPLQLTVDLATHPILVVEDDAINRKVVERFLNKLGVSAVYAENGQYALDMIVGGMHPSLILMDCQMPEMDGFTATAHIRRWEEERAQNAPAKRLPIVALTASAFEADRERCTAAGMDDFLSKPIDMGRLSVLLEKWLA